MQSPQTEAALADIIKTTKGPLALRGGGTRGMTAPGTPVSTDAMADITLYEPGAMTVVAQAGTPVAQIEKALAAENQRLAFEPMDHRHVLGTEGVPTIGGVMAANVSGPRRISVGAARDFLLGVRFVDGQGQIVKNGGRVMKNVTGYDLVKLMAGAHGTLGVLTEVSLKTLPRPETEVTLVLHGLDDAAAVAALARALGSPYEISGAAHDPQARETLLRVEGFEASVRYRAEALQALLAGDGVVEDAGQSAARWEAVRDLHAFDGTQGDMWRVSCKPSDGPALAEKAAADRVFYDWAGGLIWIAVPSGCDLRARLGRYDGHATRVRGGGDAIARFEPEVPGVARLTAGLRQRFDPRGILNAGLMG
ncbi:FAD-binding protein [Sulfitobacter sp. S190]|uniref:FAD-binding protein n=1 Tax=Sulfitobacter sp. S190 TaxID=2867022 RepID=UPI0021A59B63|nr:FAD-binding protein [Sulfitobacter sp. S190]UWR22662.1 FAD-binding protein [Sulfitobacter sp. S190]